MRIFMVAPQGSAYCPWKNLGIYNFYNLDSYIRKPDYDHRLFKDYILDSGVFSYLNGKDAYSVDWEEYTVNYAKFVKDKGIRNYVEIDIDRFFGLDTVEKLRCLLEKKVGWPCMPVWHINRGYDKWLEIVTDYDYVCFGAFLTDGLPESRYPYVMNFLRDAKKASCKVHALGFCNFNWLPKLKFYSCDSSSWATARFGLVAFFNGRRIVTYRGGKNRCIRSPKEVSFFSFKEWVKFSEYAETNL